MSKEDTWQKSWAGERKAEKMSDQHMVEWNLVFGFSVQSTIFNGCQLYAIHVLPF